MQDVKWYNRKALVVLLHFCCWLFLLGLPFLFQPNSPRRSAQNIGENKFGYFFAVKTLVWIGLFYLHAYLIVPIIIYQKRLWIYIALLLNIVIFLFLMDSVLGYVILERRPFVLRLSMSYNFFPILFILTASMAFRMITDRAKEDRIKKEKETENLKTELSLLRSQVSPHFMFNIMNNMVALARKKSDILESSLIKLSSLLRYMLYETDEKVPLKKEIEYLQSYIDLQRQRFGGQVKIDTSMQQADGRHEIEPMLLIPFVENAFKHGVGLIENAEIDISLKTEKDTLYFVVRNKFSETSDEIKDKSSGIGLMNVQRRLELLYAGKHSLLVTKQHEWFMVSLQIELN